MRDKDIRKRDETGNFAFSIKFPSICWNVLTDMRSNHTQRRNAKTRQ